LGVGAIADASRSARRDGRRLVLVRGLSQVERLLALTGALDAVEIVDLNPANRQSSRYFTSRAATALTHTNEHERLIAWPRCSAQARSPRR